MRRPDWKLLTAFEAVARHGSFSRAGDELNVMQPAISRRVARLERDLGVTLIERSRPHAGLTSDGEILFRAVSGSMVQVQTAIDQVRRTPSLDKVVVNTTIGFASCFLMQRLNTFRTLYPETVIELVSRDQNDAYRQGSADIVIVFDRPDRLPGVEHARIFPEHMIAVCAPAYLENGPIDENDLVTQRLLHLSHRLHADDWRNYLDGTGQAIRPPNSAERFTSFMVYLQAALNGEGIAIGWQHLLEDHLVNGLLVRPVDRMVETDRGYYACLTERGTDVPGRAGLCRLGGDFDFRARIGSPVVDQRSWMCRSRLSVFGSATTKGPRWFRPDYPVLPQASWGFSCSIPKTGRRSSPRRYRRSMRPTSHRWTRNRRRRNHHPAIRRIPGRNRCRHAAGARHRCNRQTVW